jgi:hypothetical protein
LWTATFPLSRAFAEIIRCQAPFAGTAAEWLGGGGAPRIGITTAARYFIAAPKAQSKNASRHSANGSRLG